MMSGRPGRETGRNLRNRKRRLEAVSIQCLSFRWKESAG